MSPEPFIIILVKKYLWEFVATAICLTMVHSALENIGGRNRWVTVAKGIVNGLYASFFFGGVGAYYYGEVGLVGGIAIGALVGLGAVEDVVNKFISSYHHYNVERSNTEEDKRASRKD